MLRILTGMQSSGPAHIGNYFGMMRWAKDLQNSENHECLYFVADLHSFTSKQDPLIFSENQMTGVLDWLALVIDPEKSIFYRQSDIRAHTEMLWYFSCLTSMGFMERAHAYKDKVQKGLEANVGLFTYPILMAADILLYDAEKIPVGRDQKQHVEMARDIAQRFNHLFGETFVLPEAMIQDSIKEIPGFDGSKMSKSYGNTLNIFEEEAVLRKKVMSIPTQSVALGESLDPDQCMVFQFHELFENPNIKNLRSDYENGNIGFGDSKSQLFDLIWEYFRVARDKREKLASDKSYVESVLKKGAEKAQCIAEAKLSKVRLAMGLKEYN